MEKTVATLVEFANDHKVEIIGSESIPKLAITPIITNNPFDPEDEDGYYAPKKYITMAQVNGKPFWHKQVSDQYKVTPYAETVQTTLASILECSPEFGNPVVNLKFAPGGGRMFAEFKFPKVEWNVGTKKKEDNIVPRIIVKDSIDLSGRFSATSGVFRLVCSNGLIIAHPDFKAEKFFMRHNNGTYNLELALESLNTSLKKISETTGIWKVYAKEKLSTLQITEVFEATNLSLRTQEKVLNNVLLGTTTNLLGKVKDGKASAWDVLNALTQYATHDLKGNASKEFEVQQAAAIAVDNAIGMYEHSF